MEMQFANNFFFKGDVFPDEMIVALNNYVGRFISISGSTFVHIPSEGKKNSIMNDMNTIQIA